MLSKTEVEDLICGLFEEEALVIGGMIALHGMEDSMVWRLMRNLDEIRRKTLKRLEDSFPDKDETSKERPDMRLHPAVEEFLLRVRNDG